MRNGANAVNFMQRVHVSFEAELRFCYWGKEDNDPEKTKTISLKLTNKQNAIQEANKKAREWGEELKKKGYKNGRIVSSLTKKESCLAPLIIVTL
ncbi:MAG: hypothetical protein ACE5F2_00690 [Candidatus Paceibacteria bacterium]